MKKYLMLIFIILIGAVSGFLGAMYIDYLGGTEIHILILLICFAVSVYLQIIIHEGGHLIFGLLTGYRFVSFRIGSIMLYRKQGKLKIAKFSLAGTGGQCLLAPPDMRDGKMPYILYNLGGVFMNLITAGGCIFAVITMDLGIILSCFCTTMIVVGIIFAITNGFPFSIGEVDNDGRNALSLGKTPEAIKALWLQLKINEYTTEGIRLKEMPEEWFEMPSKEAMQNSMVATIGVFHCNRLMDEMNLEKAGQSIEELLAMKSGLIEIYRSLLTLDLIYCELFGERRARILRRIQRKDMVQFMNAMKNFPSILRTQYAYALLMENDVEKANKIKKQFKKMEKKYPYEQDVKSEWELICRCD